MAASGAHLTTTLQAKPSIFEVVASDSLNLTFHPAVKRIFHSLASLNPEKFSWTIRYYDEVFMILNGFIQQYYIRVYRGSLSEVFYGLSRAYIGESVDNTTPSLQRKSKFLIFICIVILPYVRKKFENLLEKWQQDLENGLIPQKTERILKQNSIKLYRTGVAIYDCVQILQYISYMANLQASHSISLRMVQMNLNYLEPDQSAEWTWTDLLRGNLKYSTFLTSLVFRGLELSAFFLQFIQWWQNEASQGNLTNLPVPDPPNKDANSQKYSQRCPICLQEWQIPTAISISGYVFCYKCICKHFEKKSTCPVTNYPATIDDLIRVYDD